MPTRITLTAHVSDAAEGTMPAAISVTPTELLTDTADQIIIVPSIVNQALVNGAVALPDLITTDSAGINPTGWAYHITLTANGVVIVDGTYELPSTWGPTVDLAQLVQVSPGPATSTLYGVLAAGYTNTWLSEQLFNAAVAIAGGLTLDGTAIATPPGGTTAYLRADGTWDVPPGGGAGTVKSVNTQSPDGTGNVTLTAVEVGALVSVNGQTGTAGAVTLTAGNVGAVATVNGHSGTSVTVTAADVGAVASVNGHTGAAVNVTASDVGAVTSVNGHSGSAVNVTAADVGAVTSVNGHTGAAVSVTASDVGAVTSVNGHTGASVTLTASDVSAIPTSSAGAANGVATLNASSQVPIGQLPAGVANGLAALNASSQVPIAQLPAGVASGVAGLDGTGKVPLAQLPTRSLTADMQTYSVAGPLVAIAGTLRFYVDGSWTITSVRASVGTAPAGASIIVDVQKNGTTIFTTTANRPTIAAAANTGLSGTPDVTGLVTGDYLTISVLQVGSTTAGSDLIVSINATKNEN